MTKSTEARWMRRLAASIALLLLVLLPSPAQAHASLIVTDPEDGKVLASAPETITVTFNERVSLAPQGNQLLDATGKPIDAKIRAVDNLVTYTPAGELDEGTYIVSWRVISADSHPVAGGISFSVGKPSDVSIAVPTSEADRQVSLLKSTAEFLRYAGVLGMTGLAAFGLFIACAATRRSTVFARRVRRTTQSLALVAAVSAILLIPLVRMWQDGDPLSRIWSWNLWRDAATGDSAIAACVLVVGMAAALVGVRRGLTALAAAGLATAAGSLIIVGHTRAFGPAALVLSADLIHIATAALWFGGIIGLCLLLAPDKEARAADVAAAVGRFSGVAIWLTLGLGVAAVVLWWRIANSIDGLWNTDYGRLVLIKLGLVLVVVAVAAYNRYRIVPAIKANQQRAFQMTRLRRTVAAEGGLLLAAILATGVLMSQTPPVAAAPAKVAQQVETVKIGTGEAELTLTPGKRGTNSIQVALVDENGAPLIPFETPELTVAIAAYDLGPFNHPLSKTGDGTYEATADFPLEGTWKISLSVRLSEFENPVASTEVDIP